MDDKILGSLIQILQKQSNTIRKLRVLNIVLADSLWSIEKRMGVPYEEFAKSFQETLAAVEANRPAHDPQGIAKEIEETIDLMNLLEKQREQMPN